MYNKSRGGVRMDKQLKIMLDQATLDQLQDKARTDGHTVSWILRQAIEGYLAGWFDPRNNEKPAKRKGGKLAA
jgi:hypothetical protein